MKKKTTNNTWAGYGFFREEWNHIKSTWNVLVNNDNVIIGDSKHSTDNLHAMLKALKASNNSFGKNL